MKPYLISLAVILAIVAMPFTMAAQEPTAKADKKTADAIARIEKLLNTVIETKGFQDAMPLHKFLAALEARLPKGDRVAIGIDEKAFGEDLPEVVGSQVQLPAVPKEMTLGTALRLGMSQIVTDEVDYDLRSTGIVVTHPRGGARTIVHDARDVVKLLPELLPTVIQNYRDRDVFHGVNASDGTALLIRLLANDVRLQPWETIEVLNGTRLKVFAAPQTQRNIRDLLRAFGKNEKMLSFGTRAAVWGDGDRSP